MHLKAFFSMLLISLLLLSANRIGVASSPETTYIYVSPADVNATGQPVGYRFPVNINVTDAPNTYAWDVVVKWDPNILSVFLVSEGDFLKRPPTNYQTTFTYYPTDVALASQWGNISVGCSLLGGLPMNEWAAGNGWLCRLGFEVKATGSTVIGLSGTVLLDRLESGAPAPTPYPNLDGFFFNAQFHDIAVTDIVASPSEVRAEELVSINVTLANKGNFTETSDVAVYADIVARDPANPDTILVGDEITVGTHAVTGLASGATTKLSFTWNTTGVEDGNYTISAKSLLSDNNPSDSIFIDGKITVKPPALLHDIAIISVVPSPTGVKVGDSVVISIEVKNEGNFSETFSVTAYADLDTTVLGDEITIGTKSDVALTNGTSTTLTITWDTKGVSAGTYTISAKVPPVANEREADKADNTKVDNTVKVQAESGPDYTWYVVGIIIVIIIVAAVVIYFFRFRKK
jgi:hypothetical protein